MRLGLWIAVGTALAAGGGGRVAGAFCFERAGALYRVAPGLLAVVAEQESGMDPEARGRNADGTYDVGLMQINSSWRTVLGETRWRAVATDPCYNVIVGAWVLRDCLDRYGYSWEGLGCYNATSEDKRAAYARKLAERMWRKLGRAKGTRRK